MTVPSLVFSTAQILPFAFLYVERTGSLILAFVMNEDSLPNTKADIMSTTLASGDRILSAKSSIPIVLAGMGSIESDRRIS